jgi:HPt (histidine-containing phosphotransfer) domain-containing protein
MSSPNPCDDLGDEFAELQREFLTMTRRRLAELTDLLMEAGPSVPAGARGEEFRRIAHSLRGAGGSYGFDSISEVAARLEKAYIAGRTRDCLAELIECLKSVVEDSENGRFGSGAE